MLNKVQLIGNLGKDAKEIHLSTGDSFVALSLATTKYWRDKAGARQQITTWHEVNTFVPSLKSFALQYLKKGQQVYVEGELNQYTTEKDAQKQFHTKVLVGRDGKICLLGHKPNSHDPQDQPHDEAEEGVFMEGVQAGP